jgi:hypothetical protein
VKRGDRRLGQPIKARKGVRVVALDHGCLGGRKRGEIGEVAASAERPAGSPRDDDSDVTSLAQCVHRVTKCAYGRSIQGI